MSKSLQRATEWVYYLDKNAVPVNKFAYLKTEHLVCLKENATLHGIYFVIAKGPSSYHVFMPDSMSGVYTYEKNQINKFRYMNCIFCDHNYV